MKARWLIVPLGLSAVVLLGPSQGLTQFQNGGQGGQRGQRGGDGGGGGGFQPGGGGGFQPGGGFGGGGFGGGQPGGGFGGGGFGGGQPGGGFGGGGFGGGQPGGGGGRGGRGGIPGMGGMGGMMPDPSQAWQFLAGGKDVWVRPPDGDMMQRAFDGMARRLNLNGANQITKEQFLTMSQQLMQGGGGRGPGGGGGGPGGPPRDPNAMADRWFQRQDANSDGVLNYDEMPEELRSELHIWDKDGNNLIDQNEFREFAKAFFQKQAANNAADPNSPWSSILDPNGPQSVPDEDKKQTVYRAGRLPKELPAWFAELDVNKDGQVSLHEWRTKGWTDRDFFALDRNNDGFLTVEEVLRTVSPKKIEVAKDDSPGANPQMMMPGMPQMGGTGRGGAPMTIQMNGPGGPMQMQMQFDRGNRGDRGQGSPGGPGGQNFGRGNRGDNGGGQGVPGQGGQDRGNRGNRGGGDNGGSQGGGGRQRGNGGPGGGFGGQGQGGPGGGFGGQGQGGPGSSGGQGPG